jgi:hypothetical protein
MARTREELADEERALALIDRITGGDGAVHGDVLRRHQELEEARVVLDAEYLARLTCDAIRLKEGNEQCHQR